MVTSSMLDGFCSLLTTFSIYETFRAQGSLMLKTKLAVTFSIVTGLLTFSPIASDMLTAAEPLSWPQWRGPGRTATLPEGLHLPAKLSGETGLQEVWKIDLSPSYSGPVIQDGILVTTETVDAKYERTIAIETATGKELWQHQWEGAMSVPFFAKKNGDWIRATPAIADGRVYVAGMRDVLVCMDLKTGNEIWKCDFTERFKSEVPAFGFASSPLVDQGAVYVQAGGALCKLNAETGETIWRTLAGQAGMDSAFASPVIETLCGVRQLVVQTRDELCGVEIESGKVLWNQPIDAFRGMNILTPTVHEDTVFTSAYGGRANLWRIKHEGDAWSVEQIWDEKHQAYMSSPVLMPPYLYLHLRNTRFMCLDMTDGSEKWVTKPVGDYWSLIGADNRLLSLSSDGVLRLIEASPEEYRELDSLKVADDSWAHLAITEDMVFVRHLGGLIAYRFQADPVVASK